MKSKDIKHTPKNKTQLERNYVFLKSNLLDSKYIPFIISTIYFIVMLITALPNRKLGDYGVETDLYWSYIPQAKELLNGSLIIDPFRGPMYQIVLAVFGFLFGHDFFSAGMFISVLFASISIFFVFGIINSILNRESALVTVLLLAVNLNFLNYSYEAGTDMLFFAFYTSSIYFIFKSDKLDHKNYLIAGILSGFAYLTRYTGISLIVSVLIIFIINIRERNKKSESFFKNIPVKSLLYYFTPVVLLILFWGIFCYQKTGSFFFNMNYRNTAYSVYKPADMTSDEWTTKYEQTFNSFSDVIFKDAGAFFYKIFINNFTSYFINDLNLLMPVYIRVLVVLGLIIFIMKINSQSLLEKYFFLSSLLFYIQILFAFYSERFSLPLLPIYYFLVVKFFSYDFLQKFNLSLGRIKLFALIVLVMFSLNFYQSYEIIKIWVKAYPVEILSIKEWMDKNRSESLDEKIIFARKPHIAYTLDMKFVVIPFLQNYDEFLANVRLKNIDYVYVSYSESNHFNELLRKQLLDYKNPPKELETLVYVQNPLAILYKVRK